SCTPRSSADVLQVDDDVGIGAQLLEERDHGLVAVLLAQLLLDLRLHLLQRRALAGTAPLGPLGLGNRGVVELLDLLLRRGVLSRLVGEEQLERDRKSTRLNSSHVKISY